LNPVVIVVIDLLADQILFSPIASDFRSPWASGGARL
jgi:hypothetical protein